MKKNKNQKTENLVKKTGVTKNAVGIVVFDYSLEQLTELQREIKNAKADFPILHIGAQQQENITSFSADAGNDLQSFIATNAATHWICLPANASFSRIKTINQLQFDTLADEADVFMPAIDNGKIKPKILFPQWVYLKANAFFTPAVHQHAAFNTLVLQQEILANILINYQPKQLEDFIFYACITAQDKGTFNLLGAEPEKLNWIKAAKTNAGKGLRFYARWFFKDAVNDFKHALGFHKKFEAISRLLFTSLVFLMLIVMPTISVDYGITWDEKMQYEFAQDMYKYFTSAGSDTTVFDYSKGMWSAMQYYGSSFDLLTVAVIDVFNLKNEFEARHFLNAIMGVLAMLFAGLTAKAVTKKWVPALLTLLLLCLTPSFFGHSMNNPKDIPFAAGFFMATYYMVLYLRQLPNPTFAAKLFFIMGAAWAISVRVGGILIFPFLILFAGIRFLGFYLNDAKAGLKTFKPIVLNTLWLVVAGYFLGLIVWPYALRDPINNPLNALKQLSNVNYTTSYENFDGVRTYMSAVPWYYSFKFIGITVPLTLLAGLILHLFAIPSLVKQKKAAWSAMLAFIFCFPIAYAVYKGSMLYNGWRHWFFVYHALVILSVIGWYYFLSFKKALVSKIILVVFSLSLVPVLIWQFKSHPNQYVYFNELVGGIKGAYGNYETDYYSNSMKQAADWLCKNVDLQGKSISIATNNEPLTAQYYISKCSDSATVLWTREYELSKKETDYAFFTTRTMSKAQLNNGSFPPKGTIHTIEVSGVPLLAIVKRENNFSAKGYAFTESGQWDSAIIYLKKAIDYEPANEENYKMLGMVYISLSDNYNDSAHQVIDKAIQLLPESFVSLDIKGMAFVNQRKFEEALTFFEKSIAVKINYTAAYFHKGIVHMNTAQYAKAITAFESAIKYGGHKFEFYKYLGFAYYNMSNFNNALQYLGYAMQLNERDPEVLDAIGQCYQNLGDMSNATRYRDMARQLRGY